MIKYTYIFHSKLEMSTKMHSTRKAHPCVCCKAKCFVEEAILCFHSPVA